MQRRAKYLELSCRQCHWRETCGPEDIAGWLRKTGKLRAGRVPELAVLYELLEASAPALVCPKCGQTGLGVAVALDDEDWPDLVSCEACGKPIPKERLEAIPGTPLCAACQHLSDLGHPKPRQDFCPRCGASLEVRVATVGGATRYVLACSNNPPCNLG